MALWVCFASFFVFSYRFLQIISQFSTGSSFYYRNCKVKLFKEVNWCFMVPEWLRERYYEQYLKVHSSLLLSSNFKLHLLISGSLFLGSHSLTNILSIIFYDFQAIFPFAYLKLLTLEEKVRSLFKVGRLH